MRYCEVCGISEKDYKGIFKRDKKGRWVCTNCLLRQIESEKHL